MKISRELDRKEDERVARDQAALTAQLQEELRRDKVLDTASAHQQGSDFDEQPVGGKGGNNKPASNLFRAPSPILEVGQRNKNLFKAPSSPIEDNTSKSPVLPAQRNKNIFRAPSPVLEQPPPGKAKHNLFASSPPPSPHYHNEARRNSSHPNSRQSHHNNHSAEENRHQSSRVLSPPVSPAINNRHQNIVSVVANECETCCH